MKTVHLKVTGTREIIDPISKKKVDQKGQKVRMSTFWSRRLKDGSVVLVDEVPQVSKNKKGGK
jgi:hypothetical protein